jgi:hypothetical protein
MATAKEKSNMKTTKKSDVPSLFRLNVEVADIDAAAKFYGELMALDGRPQAGARCYFPCGGVTLQVLQVGKPNPANELYFIVDDLEAIFARAKALGCLSKVVVHGEPGGEILVRPWGERSFYVEDAWANGLCFVEKGTVYAG